MFRRLHPEAIDFVVLERASSSVEKRLGDMTVWFVTLPELVKRLIPAR